MVPELCDLFDEEPVLQAMILEARVPGARHPRKQLLIFGIAASESQLSTWTLGREIRLRRITDLGLNLPERFQLNRQCSVDPVVA
jgi:hypothetical protein